MSRPRIYTAAELRERKRERCRLYRIKNREKIKAYKQSEAYREKRKGYNRRYAEKHPDYMAKWRAAHPDYMRKWQAENKDRLREYHREYARRYASADEALPRSKLTPEQRKERAHLKWFKRIIREMLDCDFYAHNRRKARESQYKRWAKQGKNWTKGQPARRIPDWCVRGAVLDARSQWLPHNITPEQKAWARELCIERKTWRENNEWRLTR